MIQGFYLDRVVRDEQTGLFCAIVRLPPRGQVIYRAEHANREEAERMACDYIQEKKKEKAGR